MGSISVIVLMYIYLCILLLGDILVSLASPSNGTASSSSAPVAKDEISLSGGSACEKDQPDSSPQNGDTLNKEDGADNFPPSTDFCVSANTYLLSITQLFLICLLEAP